MVRALLYSPLGLAGLVKALTVSSTVSPKALSPNVMKAVHSAVVPGTAAASGRNIGLVGPTKQGKLFRGTLKLLLLDDSQNHRQYLPALPLSTCIHIPISQSKNILIHHGVNSYCMLTLKSLKSFRT